MEEQAKWDDGSVDFGIKPVTEYTDAELRLAFGALAQKVEQLEMKNTMFQQLSQEVYGQLQNKVSGIKSDVTSLEQRVDLLTESTKSTLFDVSLHRESINSLLREIDRLKSPADEDLVKLAEAVLSVSLDKFSPTTHEVGIFAKMLSIESQVMAQAEDVEEARADGE